jgi:hypothetical protein
MIGARRAASILVLVPACFDPVFQGTRCGEGNVCPPGLTCRSDGTCRTREQEPATPDASIDASIDASFDVSLCPASYNLNLQLPGPSRYRLIFIGQTAGIQSDDCNDDLPGATHLVVLETMAEVIAIGNLVDTTTGIAGDDVWIGGVQLRNSPDPGANWLGFDGAPLIDAWAAGEPDDDTGEGNNEQFVKVARTRNYLVDIEGTEPNGAVCECDGKPVAQNAVLAIDSNR